MDFSFAFHALALTGFGHKTVAIYSLIISPSRLRSYMRFQPKGSVTNRLPSLFQRLSFPAVPYF